MAGRGGASRPVLASGAHAHAEETRAAPYHPLSPPISPYLSRISPLSPRISPQAGGLDEDLRRVDALMADEAALARLAAAGGGLA